jgi:hypothetical protein
MAWATADALGQENAQIYWRHPTVGLPAIAPEEPVAELPMVDRETLAPELERVTRLGLQKLDQIIQCAAACGRDQAEPKQSCANC